MKKQKTKVNKNKLDQVKLIAEIGSLTVQLEELKDKNKMLERGLLTSKLRQSEIKSLLDKYQKFREDLVGFITRY